LAKSERVPSGSFDELQSSHGLIAAYLSAKPYAKDVALTLQSVETVLGMLPPEHRKANRLFQKDHWSTTFAEIHILGLLQKVFGKKISYEQSIESGACPDALINGINTVVEIRAIQEWAPAKARKSSNQLLKEKVDENIQAVFHGSPPALAVRLLTFEDISASDAAGIAKAIGEKIALLENPKKSTLLRWRAEFVRPRKQGEVQTFCHVPVKVTASDKFCVTVEGPTVTRFTGKFARVMADELNDDVVVNPDISGPSLVDHIRSKITDKNKQLDSKKQNIVCLVSLLSIDPLILDWSEILPDVCGGDSLIQVDKDGNHTFLELQDSGILKKNTIDKLTGVWGITLDLQGKVIDSLLIKRQEGSLGRLGWLTKHRDFHGHVLDILDHSK